MVLLAKDYLGIEKGRASQQPISKKNKNKEKKITKGEGKSRFKRDAK